MVESDSVGTNQIGIAVAGNAATLDKNTVFNSVVLDGIFLMGDNNRVTGNRILHSYQDGVFVQGNGNQIVDNEIIEASVGSFKVSGSAATSLSNNDIYATLAPIKDPEPIRATNLVPMR